MSIIYKAINGQAAVDIPAFVAKITYGQQHNSQIVNIRINKDCYKYSYFPSTVWCWNLLPTQIVEATSVESLQNHFSAWGGGAINFLQSKIEISLPLVVGYDRSLFEVLQTESKSKMYHHKDGILLAF